jgi:acetylornithine deacetylase
MQIPGFKQMLGDLIATPSMSSVSPEFDVSNRDVVNLLANWLEDAGFDVDVSPLPNQPDKANLLARLGPKQENSEGLMFAGHTDTVPFDAHLWNYDPFKIIETNQRFYGLGTSDMKAYFAIVLDALRNIPVKELRQPIYLLATADEESSMDGAKLLVEQGCPNVRYAVIGEPTGLTPVHAHKGIIMESIRLTGQSGHSSDPSLGHNALEAMNEVINDILKWRHQLQQRYRDDRFTVPYPTLNLGHIIGGDNPNRICGECEMHIDLRPLPGMDLEELRQGIRQQLGQRFDDSAIDWQLHSLIDGTPPMHTPRESALVQEAEKLTCNHSHAVAFCTEGPYLNELGIETIILGPGDIDQAHQPDEYLALDRIKPMQNIIRSLVKRFCL